MNYHRPSPPPGKYRLSVGDYAALAAAGAFGDRRTELIGGEVFVMAPEFRPHLRAKSELAFRLRDAVRAAKLDFFVAIDGSVLFGPHDMPRPDIFLTRAIEGEGAVPADSVALIVEIASSSTQTELASKIELYARAAIPEYWVVELTSRTLNQLWRPEDGAHRARRRHEFGATLNAATLGLLQVDTTGL